MAPVIIPNKPRTKKSPTTEETIEEKRDSGCLYEKRKTTEQMIVLSSLLVHCSQLWFERGLVTLDK